MKFVIFKESYTPLLRVGLLEKETELSYRIADANEALGLRTFVHDKIVSKSRVVMVTENKHRAQTIVSVMRLIGDQHHAVVKAADEALRDNVNKVIESLKDKTDDETAKVSD